MSGEPNPTQASAANPKDLKIQEQAQTIAELTAQVKNLEEKSAKLEDKLAKLEALLASQAEAKSSKTSCVHRKL